MTKAQARTIEWLKEDILLYDGLGKEHVEDYEYKKFIVSEPENTNRVFLYTVVGSKKDEGTMGAVLCRRYRNIMIGPRGGVSSISPGHKTSGYHQTLIRGYSY